MKNELLDTVLNELKEKKKKPCDCEMEESTQVGASKVKRESNRAASIVAAARIHCNRHEEGSELHQQCMYDAMNKQNVEEQFKAVLHQSVSNRIMGKEELNEDIVELLRGVKDLHGLIATHIRNQEKKKKDDEEEVNEQRTVDRPRIPGAQSTPQSRTRRTTTPEAPRSGRNIGISQRGPNKGKRVADLRAPLPGTPEYDSSPEVYQAMQNALNTAGLAPVLGIPADLVAAGHSLYHGKLGDAGLNLVSTVPLAGEVVGGAKLAAATLPFIGKIKRGTKAADEVKQVKPRVKLKDPSKGAREGGVTRLDAPAPKAPDAPAPKAPDAPATKALTRRPTVIDVPVHSAKHIKKATKQGKQHAKLAREENIRTRTNAEWAKLAEENPTRFAADKWIAKKKGMKDLFRQIMVASDHPNIRGGGLIRPTAGWGHAIKGMSKRYGPAALVYGGYRGVKSLTDWVKEEARKKREDPGSEVAPLPGERAARWLPGVGDLLPDSETIRSVPDAAERLMQSDEERYDAGKKAEFERKAKERGINLHPNAWESYRKSPQYTPYQPPKENKK